MVITKFKQFESKSIDEYSIYSLLSLFLDLPAVKRISHRLELADYEFNQYTLASITQILSDEYDLNPGTFDHYGLYKQNDSNTLTVPARLIFVYKEYLSSSTTDEVVISGDFYIFRFFLNVIDADTNCSVAIKVHKNYIYTFLGLDEDKPLKEKLPIFNVFNTNQRETPRREIPKPKEPEPEPDIKALIAKVRAKKSKKL